MIHQTLTDSFKEELLLGVHDFRPDGDVFKLALYTSAANLGADTTAYTSQGEVVGSGYTPGGITLVSTGTRNENGVGFVSFEDVVFLNASFTARGALIYNTTPSAPSRTGGVLVNPSVCVLDFGSDKTVVGADFVVDFPPASPTTALIKVSRWLSFS